MLWCGDQVHDGRQFDVDDALERQRLLIEEFLDLVWLRSDDRLESERLDVNNVGRTSSRLNP